MNKLETNIPFAGFYYTGYDEVLQNALDSQVEYKQEEDKLTDAQASAYFDLLFRFTNWRQAQERIAEEYVEAFNKVFYRETGVELGLTFMRMISPREYNFETDRIFCAVDKAAFIALRAAVDEAVLRRVIEERFTSRSGFISFYPNSLDEWPGNVLAWDVNQLCTLLMCFLPEDWEHDVFDYTFFEDEAFSAWEAAVDWPKVEELWAEYLQEETT